MQLPRQYMSRYLVMISAVLAGCMQNPAMVNADRPDWLASGPAQYPNSQYITATGSADDQERARDRALANLSKVFETRIRESSTAISDVRSQKSGGEERVDSSQRLRRNIQVQTSKIIDGARIAEQWYDRTEIMHHALAVLDRRQAANNLRGEMERLDTETRLELDRAQQGSNSISRIAQLGRAIEQQQERAALQKTLKVIDLSGRGEPPRWNLAELRQRLDQGLVDLRMAIAVKQDDLGELPSQVAGAMSHAGFPASSSDYEYVLTAALSLQPSFQQQGWHWLRGTLSLTLTDSTGRVMGNRSWPVKVSSVQQELLAPRMNTEVEKLLKEELKGAVLGFAEGGSEG